MRNRIKLILCLAVIFSLLPLTVFANELFPPFSEDSKEGFKEMQVDGKPYLVRIRRASLFIANFDEPFYAKHCCTIFPGSSCSVTESFTISATSSYSSTSKFEGGFKLGKVLEFVNEYSTTESYSETVTHKTEIGRTFRWDDVWDPATMVNIYSAMIMDRYELIIDYVPRKYRTASQCKPNCDAERDSCIRRSHCSDRACYAKCDREHRNCMKRCQSQWSWDYKNMITEVSYLDIPHQIYDPVPID